MDILIYLLEIRLIIMIMYFYDKSNPWMSYDSGTHVVGL